MSNRAKVGRQGKVGRGTVGAIRIEKGDGWGRLYGGATKQQLGEATYISDS